MGEYVANFNLCYSEWFSNMCVTTSTLEDFLKHSSWALLEILTQGENIRTAPMR